MADTKNGGVVEGGEEILTLADTCTTDDIEEAVKGFLLGDLTLAQLEGMTAENLYSIADLGYDFLEEGKYDNAQKIFEGLNVYNPYDSYFHAALGSIYQKQGRKDDAILRYQAATELYPEDINSWTNLGEVLLERSTEVHKEGDSISAVQIFTAAIDAFKKVMELDPKAATPSGLRARALIEVTATIAKARGAA